MCFSLSVWLERSKFQKTGKKWKRNDGKVNKSSLNLCKEILSTWKAPEFFLNNTNLTFLTFLCKIDIEGFQKSAKNKVASSGNQTHNTNHLWIRRQMPIPLCHPDMCWIEDPQTELCFMLHFTYWTWIISIFNRAWFFLGMIIWDWQGMTDWLSG